MEGDPVNQELEPDRAIVPRENPGQIGIGDPQNGAAEPIDGTTEDLDRPIEPGIGQCTTRGGRSSADSALKEVVPIRLLITMSVVTERNHPPIDHARHPMKREPTMAQRPTEMVGLAGKLAKGCHIVEPSHIPKEERARGRNCGTQNAGRWGSMTGVIRHFEAPLGGMRRSQWQSSHLGAYFRLMQRTRARS